MRRDTFLSNRWSFCNQIILLKIIKAKHKIRMPIILIEYEFSSLIFLLYIYSLDYRISCVKITTGTEKSKDGYLKVTINDVSVADNYQALGAAVVDECFDSLKTIKLSGPNNNAWRGQIVITVDGKPTSIACITKTCSGSTTLLSGNIVVEADSDSKSWGDTRCLNGNKCSLSWTTTGFICFKHNDIYCLEIIT